MIKIEDLNIGDLVVYGSYIYYIQKIDQRNVFCKRVYNNQIRKAVLYVGINGCGFIFATSKHYKVKK